MFVLSSVPRRGQSVFNRARVRSSPSPGTYKENDCGYYFSGYSTSSDCDRELLWLPALESSFSYIIFSFLIQVQLKLIVIAVSSPLCDSASVRTNLPRPRVAFQWHFCAESSGLFGGANYCCAVSYRNSFRLCNVGIKIVHCARSQPQPAGFANIRKN